MCRYVTLIIEESTSGETDTNLTGVRAFRVLRALKSISAVPGKASLVYRRYEYHSPVWPYSDLLLYNTFPISSRGQVSYVNKNFNMETWWT